ncbi:MAG TPA: hypothetical protein VK843_15590 [Planctomycetota bacterium]|nr:hypothetical protein [Planctomycetota bacterium]
MKVAIGFKAHSGWAAAVVVGLRGGEFEIVDRRRVELVDVEWAKAPYHAAEEMKPEAARKLIGRGVEAANRIAVRELRAMVERERERGNAPSALALLAGAPMPPWSVDEIRAVHFRMHKAEGAMFRDALARAAGECGVSLVAIPEKELAAQAEAGLGMSVKTLSKLLGAFGKSVGAPWGKDQKDAALAAMIALKRRPA